LIPPEQRVSNDFAIEGAGQVGIVTGSNMAGKSTFLRTVGVNAVLAFAGAPVCADQLDLSIFQVFTSMRTKDNLVENISSFYAELLRLKSLLQSINDTRPLLFLLDEILKGTNSTDRHLGAESLAIQLSQSNAFGLISTHDLQLGELKLDARKLKNYNFSSEIDGEEIVFDYKLREGICMSTNASQLMSKIGINIHLSI
jgi:DNA mismatch repair ATPase MutS